MEFIGILFSLFFAVIITVVFSLAFKNTGPWGGFWVFFILMFFISFGAGEWAAQRGPSAWGYYWAPGLIAAIVFALVLAATSPKSHGPRRNIEQRSNVDTKENTEVAVSAAVFGIFFWMLIVLLALIAIAGLLSKM